MANQPTFIQMISEEEFSYGIVEQVEGRRDVLIELGKSTFDGAVSALRGLGYEIHIQRRLSPPIAA